MNNYHYLRSTMHNALLVACLLASPLATAGPYGSYDFRSGQKAFQAGDLEKALREFRESEFKGLDVPALHYNLGVTLYLLKRYSEAEESFNKILGDTPLNQIGQYNLGLCAAAQDEEYRARKWLNRALAGPDARISELAKIELAELDAPKAEPVPTPAALPPPVPEAEAEPEASHATLPKRWFAGAGASFGSDNNIIDLNRPTAARSSDSYLELMLYGGYNLGQKPTRWNLNASFFSIDYQTANNYDIQMVRAGVSRDQPWREWRGKLGLDMQGLKLNGAAYLNQAGLTLEAKRLWENGNRLRSRLQISSIKEADPAYAYLKGTRLDLSLLHTQPWRGNSNLKLGYRIRHDQRADNTTTTSFTSYSPLSHILRAEISYPFNQRWSGSGKLRLYSTSYPDANLLSNGSRIKRSDSRFALNLKLSRHFTPLFSADLSYSYTDNSSNISTYSYNSQRISAGVIYAF